MSDIKDFSIVNMPIKKLKPATYNPRKISETELEKLVESIKEYWPVQPIIVNMEKGRENIIIWGHQRLKAMIKIWYTEAPTIQVYLSEFKEKTLNIALNKISWEWDYERLWELLSDIHTNADFDITLTWFDMDDIQATISSVDEVIERHDKAQKLRDSMLSSWINPEEAQSIADVYEFSKDVAKEDMKDVNFSWEIKQRFLINFWIDDEETYQELKEIYGTGRDIEQDVEKLKNITREAVKYDSKRLEAVTKWYYEEFLKNNK